MTSKWVGRGSPEGLLLGVALDALLGDPRRGHPVAAFGRAASALERRVYADSRARGVVFSAVLVCGAAGLGVVAEKAARGRAARAAVTAVATWAVLGGTSLGREGRRMAHLLENGDLDAARRRLPHLCARDPDGMDEKALARATVESVAENTSDAAVAPLLWGAVAGVPGLLAYRAINTLDAMVGYRDPRYLRFGWASARLDDAANWAPARLTGLLAVACAAPGGRAGRAWRALRRDGAAHPSPNAGRCEAAFAGALGVRLGGVNVYGGRVEERPELGDGRVPETGDIRRAVRLSTAVTLAAAAVAAVGAAALGAAVAASGRRG
ncbi:cobalamin biosynthesis protein [Actinomadura miaoliensis]|uniref:Cobalamin biosynthesis protein CobD n=1 Tax=Actinomadura miaoliensis TaxID=430685 RepID=A0ABP7W9P0_9ACTN